MKNIILFISLLVFTVSSCSADNENERKLTNQVDAYVTQRLEQLKVPGYHLAVIKNGKVILNKSYGYADLKTHQLVTDDTVFGLASITKTFTAITLLKLAELNYLKLDDPLGKYIPSATLPYQKMTIRELALMTAGVPSRVPVEMKWPEQMRSLMNLPVMSEPNTAYLYSNFSYRLLGQVIENVTQLPYLEVVRKYILNPARMYETGTVKELGSSLEVARPYIQKRDGSLQEINYKDSDISFAAGMLAISGNDLIKYVQGLLDRQFVSTTSYQLLWYKRDKLLNGKIPRWGFGFFGRFSSTNKSKYLVDMGGGLPGIAATILLVPRDKCAVMALSNLRTNAVYKIAHQVSDMVCMQG